MALILKKAGEETTKAITIWHKDGRPATAEADGSEAVVFHIRRWTGRDMRHFGDIAEGRDDEGKPVSRWGSVSMAKIVSGVVSIDGLEDSDGKKLTRMTEEVHAKTDQWILDRILEELNAYNSVPARAEGE